MIELASLPKHGVAFDRDLVFNFVRECQLLAGKFPGASPQEIVVLLRRFADHVPSPSTVIARAVVQYLVVEVVSRVRTAVPGWRAEWEAKLTVRLGSEVPTGTAFKRALEEVAAHISEAQQLEATSSPPVGTEPQRKVRAALEIIQRRYNEPGFGLRTVATRVLLTPSHLDRLLTRHTGHSFVHHLRSARLETVQRILSSTALSIKQVAARAGYNSVTHLDRDFRKHIGCSPSQWRRQNNC